MLLAAACGGALHVCLQQCSQRACAHACWRAHAALRRLTQSLLHAADAACSYDEGQCHCVGVGHSGEVTALAVAPDRSVVVSVGGEGGIFIWEYGPPASVAAGDGGGDA